MTDLLQETNTKEWQEDSTLEPSHIVDCPDDKADAQSWVTEARVFGLTVTAICGKQFIPSKAVENRPICQPCIEEANNRTFNGG